MRLKLLSKKKVPAVRRAEPSVPHILFLDGLLPVLLALAAGLFLSELVIALSLSLGGGGTSAKGKSMSEREVQDVFCSAQDLLNSGSLEEADLKAWIKERVF